MLCVSCASTPPDKPLPPTPMGAPGAWVFSLSDPHDYLQIAAPTIRDLVRQSLEYRRVYSECRARLHYVKRFYAYRTRDGPVLANPAR